MGEEERCRWENGDVSGCVGCAMKFDCCVRVELATESMARKGWERGTVATVLWISLKRSSPLSSCELYPSCCESDAIFEWGCASFEGAGNQGAELAAFVQRIDLTAIKVEVENAESELGESGRGCKIRWSV